MKVKTNEKGQVIRCMHMGGPFPEPVESPSALRCRMAVFSEASYGDESVPNCYATNTDCVVYKYLKRYQAQIDAEDRERKRQKELSSRKNKEIQYDERVSGYESYGDDYDPGTSSQ